MGKAKQAASSDEAVDTSPPPTPISEATGYRRPARYVKREFRPPDLEEGAEALWVRVRGNLPFAILDSIPFADGVTFKAAFDVIAPYVIEWNLRGENLETGEWQPVPPPAEAGPDVFDQLDVLEAFWIISVIKNGHNQKPIAEKPELTEDFLDSASGTAESAGNTSTSETNSSATAS